MIRRFITPLLSIGFVLSTVQCALVLPAFPGAQGFGSQTPGGRGGRVIEVTNLNDSGPGSLRQALEVEIGPRIVVFRTGGTINLKRRIVVSGDGGSYLTVAGQTAPGDGIQLKNWGIDIYYGAHDIVLRHLRIRPGTGSGDFISHNHALELYSGEAGERGYKRVYNVVVDHVSMEWAMDEHASAWNWVTDVTFQWCIFAESSADGQNHNAMGFLAGAETGSNKPSRFSLHHNLFAHNFDRNPLIFSTITDFRNNVIYNWYGNNTSMFGGYIEHTSGTRVNMVNNHYIKGLDAYPSGDDVAWLSDNTKIYVKGNWGPLCPTGCSNQWGLGFREYFGSYDLAAEATYRSSTPFSTPSVTTDVTSLVRDRVLAKVGAIFPRRDAVDARIVQDVKNSTGHLRSGSGYQGLKRGTPPQDTDHDGMPDTWELARGLNPYDASDQNEDMDGNGYTNVEDYLNGLANQ